MVNLAIIHNIVAPYRIPLFKKLAQHPICDELTVYYCAERYKDRLWGARDEKRFYNSKILSGITFNIPILNLPYSINPSIIQELSGKNFDALILNGFTDFTTQMALIISKVKKNPVILWSEITGYFLSNYSKLYLPLLKLLLKTPDALIVPSRISKEFHIKMGFPLEKIFVSPNTVDVDNYAERAYNYKRHKETLKEGLSINNEKVVLFVGRLIERKGITHLVKAYEEIKSENKDVGLVIVGEGPLKSHLVQLCTREGIEDVYFPGFVTEDEKIQYYSISDVFVLPSTWELHPLVLPEAMSCGLPIITTDAVASAFDMIENGKNGFIIEKGKIDDLVEAIKYALENSSKMGEHSSNLAKSKFSIANSVAGFAAAIEHVTK